ncbi:MAG TPA: site-specific DNA-methyltransferase [Rubrivivax sp.]|nr:site-specific DNA-methyltransferase [Rubrivivax sp.]HPO18017.1 site-specific DNA-methyltransferase [Rubrivivax sp.]
MPEIVFKGKEYVYNHHLSVPYRPLLAHADKGVGAPDLAGNLIIHGDNLAALKSLLPRCAGAVDLVFIDPPYNTGNEGWCYSDNVDSPIMREWLSTNPVDGEDLLRHDKWLCMMWPRLVLLRDLLSERGSIWITLDDNEVHRARMVLDEVFGENNFVATCVWHKMDSPKNTAEHFSVDHDYVLVYAKQAAEWRLNLLPRTEEMLARYQNPDNDPRGPWLLSDLDARNVYSKGLYAITTPRGRLIEGPPKGKYWRISEEKFNEYVADNRIWWGADGNAAPNIKRFLSEVKDGVVPQTLWHWQDVGSTRNAKTELLRLMSSESEHDVFVTPKPTGLLERVLAIGAQDDSLILDSFAGSGTTAHAVLQANAKDGGSRRFILVEGEDYADTLTAERVRRAINGYAWAGTQRETLLEKKITFTQLKQADKLLAEVEAIKVREGLAQGDLADRGGRDDQAPHRFDAIEAKVDDGVLRVEGVRRVSQHAPGLGGSFTFCTLGEALDLERMLSGERLPAAEALGAWLFHTATGGTLRSAPKDAPPWFLGQTDDRHVWLVYRPELAFLKSTESALTLSRAREFAAWGAAHDEAAGRPRRGHLVFASAKYLSHKQLKEHGIDFAPLPFALYREG